MTQLHGVVGGDDAPACVGTPGQWWFAPSDRLSGWRPDPRAVRLCAGCPVLARCRAYADEHHPYGLWAGRYRSQSASRYTTPELLLAAFRAHGTADARAGHRRRGEPLCAECMQSYKRRPGVACGA